MSIGRHTTWMAPHHGVAPVGSAQLSGILSDHSGSLLGDYDHGSVRVARDDRWHYGCVNDPQLIDPAHAQA